MSWRVDEFYKMVIAVLFDETFCWSRHLRSVDMKRKNIENMKLMISRILDAVLEDYNDNVRGIPADDINGMVIRQGEGKVQDQRIDLNAWRAQRIKHGKSGK